MKKSEFDNRPDFVVNEGSQVRINFDAKQVEKEIQPAGEGEPVVRQIWEAYVVRLEEPLTRSRIVDAIVTAGYPNDVMQAVQNNYLADPEDKDAKAEMDAMQAWRTKAKSIADEVLAASSAEQLTQPENTSAE